MLFGKHPNGAGAKTRLLATGHYFSLLHVLGIAGCISRSKWPQLVAQTLQTSTLFVADALSNSLSFKQHKKLRGDYLQP